MISNELKKAFQDLELNDKKNKLNTEMICCGELIKVIENHFGIPSNFNINNYDINKELKENESLTFIYENTYSIERELINILYYLKSNNN